MAESIGTARMDADGTIHLHLRATGDQGIVGDAEFIYPPGHPDYQAILKHLGNLHPGQEVAVGPWE